MSGPDKKKLDKMIWQLREGWGESARIEAARDLGWIGTQAADEAVPELIKALLGDKSENVRVEAAISLQWIGSKAIKSLSPLIKALREDPSEKVRQRAAMVLLCMGKSALKALPELYLASRDDKSVLVRDAANESLEKLAEKFEHASIDALLKANKVALTKSK
ncbi:MAG: HEAT repeat domain-containing protein [Candidatus Heimdallarchaeota archaeon]